MPKYWKLGSTLNPRVSAFAFMYSKKKGWFPPFITQSKSLTPNRA